MYCRYCGKTIPDNSPFCKYCGKSQTEISESIPVTDNQVNIDLNELAKFKDIRSNIASNALIKITKIVCYIALIAFLLFIINSISETRNLSFINYIIAASAIGTVILLSKKVFHGTSKRSFMTILIVSVFVIASVAVLNIIYEAKVDKVMAQYPSSGKIMVRNYTTTEFFSYGSQNTVYKPKTVVTIDNTGTSSIVPIELDKSYSALIHVEYTGGSGHTAADFTFTKEDLLNGECIIKEKVNARDGIYAEVVVHFKRYCSFWEVVSY